MTDTLISSGLDVVAAVMKAGEKRFGRTIADIDSDVLQTDVLTRLDGASLAALACTSTQFNVLATQESLWFDICLSKWPSTTSPRLRQMISNFSRGYRSFFSDCFAISSSDLCGNFNSTLPLHRPTEIISAVDLHHRGNLVLSKIVYTETVSGWFQSSPFRIDMLESKELVHTATTYTNRGELEEDLTLSWIVIEPISRRAMNLSSQKPVSVQRHWLSGELEARFSSILTGERGSATEYVHCGIVVTCGESEGGELQVSEVRLQVEDMDGMHLNGRDSLVIIQRRIEGKRGSEKRGEMRERRRPYAEYLEMKRKRKERKIRTKGRLDAMCIAVGIVGLASFCLLVLGS